MLHGRKLLNIALTFTFLATLGVFCLGTVFSQKQEISLQEKRQLAKFPQLSWHKSALVKWPKALGEYCKDHLVYREKLVRLNALARVELFRRSPTF